MTAQLLSGVWLDKSSVLGEGAFGVVYKGTLGDTPVAIKTIKANSPEQAAELESTLLEEAAVWASVQHPNVVQFYGVHKSDDGGLYLVSELMDGSVEGLLHEEEERVCDGDEPLLDSRQKLTMCLHVACALQRLHQLGILHSDLAARNVLYKREVGGGRTYKVTDFGLATVGMGTGAGSSASKSYQLVSREKLPVRWCSPEVLKRQLYSVEADIWSMGVYMWEVFSLAELPYGLHLTNTDIFQKIAPAKSTFRLDQPEECPDDVYAMMHKCWIFGRKQRIPLKQLEADLRQRRNSIPQPASQPASPAVQRPPAAPAARPAAPAAPGRVAAPPARAPSPARVPRPPPAPGKASAGPPPPPPGPVTGGRVQRRSSLPGSQGQGALLNAVRNARGSTSTSAAPPPASSPAADEKKARVMMAEGKAAREAESYHRAVTLFRQAEKLGSTEAVAELGRCYSAGWGVERDPAMALKLLRQAEKHGEPVALHCLGFLYSVGEGVLKEDQFKAASYWEAAAKKGLAVAHHNLGWMYANGKGPYTVDKKKAFEEYSIAAEGGYGKALAEVGRWYMSGITVPVNYAKAKQFFEKATEKRQGLAFYHLGVMYDNAWGVPKDHLQALRYYRSGDEIGDVTCKYAIGACYEKGRGTATDTATARRYYREADEKGETLASFRLGEIYFYGESGVDIDYQKSLEYLKKCSPSETPGMNYYYGMAYSLGKGRPVDLKKAIAYFEAGAKGQVGECAVALAEMYFEGRGVTRSTQRYKDYLLQGEKMGSDDASTQLALMYQDGFHGESTDLKKALVHFKRGAENGSSACKAKVAIMWLEGLTDENVPVSKIQQQLMEAAEEGSSLAHEALSRHHLPEGRLQTDPELAFKHLKIAADLGHEGCGSALAQRLLAGIGCRRDAAAAAAILKPLAEAGDEDANRDLALLYVRGDGVTKDCLKAFELFSKARPNDPIAEFEMGKMFATGDGGMKMKSQAKFYLEKAAKAGNHEAAAYLEEMRSSKKKKGSRLPWKR